MNLRQLYAQNKFESCIDTCNQILQATPDHPQANYFKGACLIRLKKYEPAKTYLHTALNNGFPSNPAQANLLRAEAGLRERNQLLSRLSELVNVGFSNYKYLENEEFDFIQGDPLFEKLREKVEINAFPCKSDPNSQKLDFWLGEWDIFSPSSGTLVASSIITKSQDGCTLYEDYEHNSGFYGRSVNYYDPADSLYKQLWVDLRNNVSRYKEINSGPGMLAMQAELGNGSLTKTTWTYLKDDDRVLQAAENSTDNGKTWIPGFSGIYRRKKVDFQKQLENCLEEMEILFREDSMEKIADYYTYEAQMLEPGGSVYNGQPAIKDYWNTLQGNGISWDLELMEWESHGKIINSIILSSLKYLDGDQEKVARTKALVVWEKTKDGWKISKDFFHFIR